MRKTGLVLGFLLATVSFAKENRKSLHDEFTGQQYGLAGCGLGSVVFGNKPGMIQVFAATSNGFMGNQTYGISSGTLNCADNNASAEVALQQKIGHLVLANRSRLENEAVQGRGETIAALAAIGHCQNGEQLGFAMQANYNELFPLNSSHDEVAKRLIPVMKTSQCLL